MGKDPVCGMDVHESNAAGTAEYNGKKYYFCCPACKAKFAKTPDQYAKA